jgi:hypothetical protein
MGGNLTDMQQRSGNFIARITSLAGSGNGKSRASPVPGIEGGV